MDSTSVPSSESWRTPPVTGHLADPVPLATALWDLLLKQFPAHPPVPSLRPHLLSWCVWWEICCLPATSANCHKLFKDHWEWPCCGVHQLSAFMDASGPMDSWISSLLRYSLIQSSFNKGKILISTFLHPGLLSQRFLRAGFVTVQPFRMISQGWRHGLLLF